jgi:hypothetical protein
MNLLPGYIRKQLPKVYATERIPLADKIAVVKFFTPDANCPRSLGLVPRHSERGSRETWYVCEFDGDDTLFGFVIGLEAEWGYIPLNELQSVRGPLGLPIERDRYWRPKPMRDAEPAHHFPHEGEQL